jgi:hypothetical protein
MVDPIPSLVNPTLPLKSANMVDPIPSSVCPTLHLESKLDTAHIFLNDTESTMLGAIPLSIRNPLQEMRPSFFIGVRYLDLVFLLTFLSRLKYRFVVRTFLKR